MPGQPKMWELDVDTLQRVKSATIFKVNTFWWPTSGLNLNLIEYPFLLILKQEVIQQKLVKQTPEKLKVINKLIEGSDPNSLMLMKNLLTKEKKENILNYCEAYRKEMTFCNDYLKEPYLQYGLFKSYNCGEDFPDLISSLFV